MQRRAAHGVGCVKLNEDKISIGAGGERGFAWPEAEAARGGAGGELDHLLKGKAAGVPAVGERPGQEQFHAWHAGVISEGVAGAFFAQRAGGVVGGEHGDGGAEVLPQAVAFGGGADGRGAFDEAAEAAKIAVGK